jgi:hypothetical protein
MEWADTGPVLGDVNPDWVFRTCNGVVIRNIFELANYLEGCNDYDFHYHVNNDHHKNDFAIWVREVVNDQKLASELDGTLDKGPYLHKIKARLKELTDA